MLQEYDARRDVTVGEKYVYIPHMKYRDWARYLLTGWGLHIMTEKKFELAGLWGSNWTYSSDVRLYRGTRR